MLILIEENGEPNVHLNKQFNSGFKKYGLVDYLTSLAKLLNGSDSTLKLDCWAEVISDISDVFLIYYVTSLEASICLLMKQIILLEHITGTLLEVQFTSSSSQWRRETG